MPEKREKREITEELKDSYLDYAMSVIISRAIPDVRDGLKPVQRRILYTMYEDGLKHDARFKKSAQVIGSVLARYHPHGDMAVYEALVRMAQDFTLRYPLVQGQGNFGSIDGDEAAAYRYTECKLSRIGEEMLKDIEKNTVDFVPNYDGTRKEPQVLPSPLPQILLNGSLGIAVGMASSIPPHNLSEVCDALLYLLEHKNATTLELCEFIKGPDFPTGGIIYGKKSIIEAYEKGNGAILMRGRTQVVETKKESFEIQITELPYGVSKSSFLQEVANLIKDKKITNIKYLRDESDRKGMKISLGIKKGGIPSQILNQLFKWTSLEKKFYLNMVVLEKGIQPKTLSLKEILWQFLNHRREVVRRRSEFELARTKERLHILEGLKKAILHIDEIINLIKRSKDTNEAKKALQKKFKFTSLQAEAILETKLRSLARLDRMSLIEEYAQRLKQKKELEKILSSQKEIEKVIKSEISELKEKFGDERRTLVIPTMPRTFEEKELIPKEGNILILTQNGYLKRIKADEFEVQKRGGRGKTIEIKEEDLIEKFLYLTSHDEVLFFTSKGRAFKTFAYEIQESSRSQKGQPIKTYLPLEEDEKVTSILAGFPERGFFLMVTKKGKVKKLPIEYLLKLRSTGVKVINFKNGDSLEFVQKVNLKDICILASSGGRIVAFEENNLRPMGKSASGVKGMRLNGEEIVGVEVLSNEDLRKKDQFLCLISEKGFVKRIKTQEIQLQKRGGRGIIVMKLGEKTGKMVAMKKANQDQEILAISQKGRALRTRVSEVPLLSRYSRGNKILKLDPEDKIASMVVI